MGYESRFYVVEKHRSIYERDIGLFYADKVAMFDMCKCPDLYDRIKHYPKTDSYIYADDGNTHIVKDDYDEKLIEIPIIDMITILEDLAETEPYRRYKPFLQLLKGFDLSEWKDLVVLHYGH